MKSDVHLARIRRAPLAAPRRARHHAVERRLAAHREIADVDDAVLRRLLLRRRIHRHPHLAAEHARIDVGEAEQRAGVVGLEIDHLWLSRARSAQIAAERRIAADLGRHREAADTAAAARQSADRGRAAPRRCGRPPRRS